MKRGADSLVGQVVLRPAMQLIQVLLVSDLRRSAPLDPLRQKLLPGVTLAVDEERLDLRPQPNELCDRLAARLLEFANPVLLDASKNGLSLSNEAK